MSGPAYARRIQGILRELGIPTDYGEVRRLPLQPEASDLIEIAHDESGPIRLSPPAAEAWNALAAAARAEGIVLLPLSGFRSVDRQTAIIREKLRGHGSVLGDEQFSTDDALSKILRVVAAPGYSEHHSGRALDVGVPDEPPLEQGFALTSGYRWLSANAARFGFRLSFPEGNPHGIQFEPWHWCYHRLSDGTDGE